MTITHIANTSGLDLSYRSTDFIQSVVLTIIDGDSILWIGDGGHYGTLDIRTQDYISKIADLAGKAETNAPKVSGKMPVIFTAQELPNLINAIELGINGMRLVKGDSPLIGREGEKALGDITLIEDPFIPGAPGSRPFDDEGVPSRRNVIFDNGEFGSFLFDSDTAGDAGRISTSNANRGMLSVPEIGLSNLVVSSGVSTLGEMTAGMKEGIIVHGVLGGGQSNLLAGDFSLNVMLGFLIRDGEYAGRITDTMVSGNVYEAFNAVSALNSRTTQVGSLFVPDVMFSALDVSGK
ncbi:Metalloprotease PmbA [subsurface metagenome]